MVRAFLFIQLIGDMTNECGNKRSVRPGREMDVLSAGRSRRSTVNTGKWPELLWLHVSPRIAPGAVSRSTSRRLDLLSPSLSLFISKLTQCHIDTPSLPSPPAPKILQLTSTTRSMWMSITEKNEFVLACKKNKPQGFFFRVFSLQLPWCGGAM